MSNYAIGDIQGCYDSLRRLLDGLGFEPGNDRLWFVGDLVNRGPHSLQVLRFVRALGDSAIVVLGNHDLHLVMQAEGYGKASDEDTLGEVLAAPDCEELIAWLRSRPLFYTEDRHALVHAGLLPQWTVKKAQQLSAEVGAALASSNHREFLARMWGSEPTAWSDELVGWDRLRVIVNAMTRMRYVRQDGAMELRAPGSKAPPERGPEGCFPWFNAPNRASADHMIICGHWSALGFRRLPNVLALDSGCLWGGQLTAVRLEDSRLFQLSCGRQVEPHGWQ